MSGSGDPKNFLLFMDTWLAIHIIIYLAQNGTTLRPDTGAAIRYRRDIKWSFKDFVFIAVAHIQLLSFYIGFADLIDIFLWLFF
jgi:hypothetical protein